MGEKLNFLSRYIKSPRLIEILKIVQKRMKEADLNSSAVVVAYYLLLSLFPLLITVGNILPYLNLDPNTVLPYVAELMPYEIFQQLKPAVVSLLTQSSTGLLSFSAVATLWSASKSISALQKAMDKAYGVERRKNFLIAKIVAFSMMMLLVMALFAVVFVLGIGQNILNWIQSVFHFPTHLLDTFSTLKWPVVVIGLLLVMMLIYRLLPNAKIHFKQVWPGALFASIGWLLLSQVFSLYLHYFSPTVASYQIIGSFIILMLWLYTASSIIVLGGVLNAVLAQLHSGKELAERKDILERLKERREKQNEKTPKH